MLMVEVEVPMFVHLRINKMKYKKIYSDTIIEITRSRASKVTRVFLKDAPKGWWLAARLMKMGSSRLYILKEVKYMDIPSKVMELSMKPQWDPSFEGVIGSELRRWGLRQ